MTVYLVSIRSMKLLGRTLRENGGGVYGTSSAHGIVDIASRHSVDETVQRLQEILEGKGRDSLRVVDHSGEAEKVGMKMRPTKLLIFGSPKAGTPVMLAAPSYRHRSAAEDSGLGR